MHRAVVTSIPHGEIITAAPTQWLVAQVVFALGAVVTAAGVALLAYRLAGQGPSAQLYSSAVLMGVGALFWTWHVYLRAVDPASFTAGEIPVWLFVICSLLTMAGLAIMGWALLQTQLSAWVGWMCVRSAILFFVLAVVLRDMPPFVYYLVTLTVGIMIYRAAAVQAGAAVS